MSEKPPIQLHREKAPFYPRATRYLYRVSDPMTGETQSLGMCGYNRAIRWCKNVYPDRKIHSCWLV